MDWQLLIPFLTAILILLITPGPVAAMIVHNTLRNGTRTGLMTALGVEFGEVIVLSAVFTGLALSQEFLPTVFRWVSFIGILYLLWLAIRAIFRPQSSSCDGRRRASSRPVTDGLTIAFSNPTTLIFYTAFFPQFISPHDPLLPQLILLGAIYIASSFTFDMLCIFGAARLRLSMGGKGRRFARLAELGSAVLYFGIAAMALSSFTTAPA